MDDATVLDVSLAPRRAPDDMEKTVAIWLAKAHAWAHAQLQQRLGEPDASVLAGEMWGERSALPPDLRAEFQETGTVHVLVTAGLHVGAVAALCLLLLSPLSLPRWLSCALAGLAIWGFAIWSGAALPAVRAATMATAGLTARACGRSAFSWNVLALAALVVVFARPQSVNSASFALSFSCVGAIFACAPLLERYLESAIALPDRVREALVLSLATQLGTWPLTAAVFLQFAPYAVLANLAVVPCVAATMGLGAVQLLVSWCAPLAQACANLNSWLLAWMLGAVRTVSMLPGAVLIASPAPAWWVAMYDAALLSAPLLWQRGARALALGSVFVAAGLIIWPPQFFDGRLRVTVLDVGQADAIVVQTPAGHTLLVDAGGRLERGPQGNDSVAERIGERIVVPFLLRHGIHALDAIVLSHPHGDHAGGVAPVFRKLRVNEFADSGQRYGGHAYRDAVATAKNNGVAIVYPRAGDQWRSNDGVVIRFLGPSLPLIQGSRNDINENSIAFTLRYHSFCMLFTGDAGAAAEARFMAERADLRCQVLKVGHHGSSYSSTAAFVAAVRPADAIISVGRHNPFGHPATQTIATLQRGGARVYRTDENGAVTIVSDGTAYQVTTMLRSAL
ncbi:MAG: DNA internalization-related competence protein ComEC/Rec2 [Candidatus Eremiobacteraeota bacterium]|nr:DNA internalization-related competence protein ComEC/Rec2 [Candidatus Eremiobacteraeota bacterium]